MSGVFRSSWRGYWTHPKRRAPFTAPSIETAEYVEDASAASQFSAVLVGLASASDNILAESFLTASATLQSEITAAADSSFDVNAIKRLNASIEELLTSGSLFVAPAILGASYSDSLIADDQQHQPLTYLGAASQDNILEAVMQIQGLRVLTGSFSETAVGNYIVSGLTVFHEGWLVTANALANFSVEGAEEGSLVASLDSITALSATLITSDSPVFEAAGQFNVSANTLFGASVESSLLASTDFQILTSFWPTLSESTIAGYQLSEMQTLGVLYSPSAGATFVPEAYKSAEIFVVATASADVLLAALLETGRTLQEILAAASTIQVQALLHANAAVSSRAGFEVYTDNLITAKYSETLIALARIYPLPPVASKRTFVVPKDSRTFVVPKDSRTFVVGGTNQNTVVS